MLLIRLVMSICKFARMCVRLKFQAPFICINFNFNIYLNRNRFNLPFVAAQRDRCELCFLQYLFSSITARAPSPRNRLCVHSAYTCRRNQFCDTFAPPPAHALALTHTTVCCLLSPASCLLH